MCTISVNVFGLVLYAILAVCFSVFVASTVDDGLTTKNVDVGFSVFTLFVIVGVFMFVPFTSTPCHDADCQCIECHAHASDCQCNECVIDRCEAINHGDTCQCDKCIDCKNIGGN